MFTNITCVFWLVNRETLYIGATNDLQRRVYEHKIGIKKFS
ncbi:GIY-YIG nuclease family protein [Polaribacter cellanae]|uniref:GIY-YIG nuclease family protein n=1 Tax=Polaribacter cellanae TaxID=2818493 RepID=A0A975CQS0_9FLAO|nr:GIY-YIG nuclease family protein [Polaribacter cellanae]